MRFIRLTSSLLMVAALAAALAGTACNKNDKKGDPHSKANIDPKIEKGESMAATAHEGWWCQEHGVPEEICSICMSQAAAKKKFKDNGDWCKLHDRAQSQCFKCDPSLYEKVFVPIHVAKTGKKPERPPETEFVDETKKKGTKT
ncbi:MAG TPA: hypothetical protein VNX28_02295 [Gemmataceae bacterium]|jgi:hypothetical protein|nr:hypothetical protein [Gemmataceae bacterium]